MKELITTYLPQLIQQFLMKHDMVRPRKLAYTITLTLRLLTIPKIKNLINGRMFDVGRKIKWNAAQQP